MSRPGAIKRPRLPSAPLCGVLLAALICSPGAAAAKTAGQARVDSRLNVVVAAVRKLGVPGGVVGVTGATAGRYARAFGNSASGRRMTLNDHFRIGSITKTFTATVILKLVKRHQLRLDDPISKWEPRVPNARRITIRMLLNMTSGIWDEGGTGSLLSKWLARHCSLTKPSPGCSRYWPPQQLVDLAIEQGAAYPPGVLDYSDTNYMLLAIIAQRVTHQPFGALLRRLIFEPLHLRHTSFPTRSLALPRPSAVGYLPQTTAAGAITPYLPGPLLSPSAAFGAGNIVSTLGDLQVWARALGTGSLLTPATQRLRLQFVSFPSVFQPLAGTGLKTGFMLGYGLGVIDAGGLLGHNGVVAPPGYSTELWYMPKRHGSVIVLLNSLTPCGGPFLSDAAAASLAQMAFGPALQRVAVPPIACTGITPAAAG